MKTKKRIVLFMAILSAIFSLNMIQSTYAKYVSSTDGISTLNVARWDIIVNDEHIKNKKEMSATITPNYLDNPNVASGVIAPGSIGYFDLTIDSSNTDVSFDFEVALSEDEDSIVKDLKLLKYYIDNENDIVTEINPNSVIEDSFKVIDENKQKNLRIYVIWDDNQETETMSNEDDTIVGHTDNAVASIKVSLKFKQTIN